MYFYYLINIIHFMNTIFIQIASFRDPQLNPTLKNMLENSKYPKNLRIGICNQYNPIDDFNIDEYRNDKRFRNRPTDKLRARRLQVVVPQSSALLKFSNSHNVLTLLFTRRTLTVFLQIRNRTMAQRQGRQIEMQTILQTKAQAVFKIQH